MVAKTGTTILTSYPLHGKESICNSFWGNYVLGLLCVQFGENEIIYFFANKAQERERIIENVR